MCVLPAQWAAAAVAAEAETPDKVPSSGPCSESSLTAETQKYFQQKQTHSRYQQL